MDAPDLVSVNNSTAHKWTYSSILTDHVCQSDMQCCPGTSQPVALQECMTQSHPYGCGPSDDESIELQRQSCMCQMYTAQPLPVDVLLQQYALQESNPPCIQPAWSSRRPLSYAWYQQRSPSSQHPKRATWNLPPLSQCKRGRSPSAPFVTWGW